MLLLVSSMLELGIVNSEKMVKYSNMQVVLVANSLPALNDVTANELPEIVAEAAKVFIETLWTCCMASIYIL